MNRQDIPRQYLNREDAKRIKNNIEWPSKGKSKTYLGARKTRVSQPSLHAMR